MSRGQTGTRGMRGVFGDVASWAHPIGQKREMRENWSERPVVGTSDQCETARENAWTRGPHQRSNAGH
ncbi:hypothetical protein E2562_001101 [Oryza meyeriana var. granulata]|uniref:Uncharacterized protein n=1 Tax=Oryza meyeriana var. granulata TaxID=110450 RepID=A0A6G1ED46_9ORYZ|nr:hypothetical protein E2562_001101 [Oryza meyeriana var. granulata]